MHVYLSNFLAPVFLNIDVDLDYSEVHICMLKKKWLFRKHIILFRYIIVGVAIWKCWFGLLMVHWYLMWMLPLIIFPSPQAHVPEVSCQEKFLVLESPRRSQRHHHIPFVDQLWHHTPKLMQMGFKMCQLKHPQKILMLLDFTFAQLISSILWPPWQHLCLGSKVTWIYRFPFCDLMERESSQYEDIFWHCFRDSSL